MLTYRGITHRVNSGAAITSLALGGDNSGNGGDIIIEAPIVNLDDGARITASAGGSGDGGNISILASQSVNLQGQQFNEAPEDAIEGDKNGSRIESQALDGSTGNAGSITITTGDLNLRDNATILSNAYEGEGGDITLNAQRIVSTNSDITTSVRTTLGNGGDVSVNADLLVLNNSDIKAQAVGGNGGEINIENVARYIASTDSILDASSSSGNSGQIITPPNSSQEFSDDDLSTEFLDISSLLKSSCASYSENSQFTVASRRGVAASPEGLQPSFEFLMSPEEINTLALGFNLDTFGQELEQRSDADWETLVTRSARNNDSKTHGDVLQRYAQVQGSNGDYQNSVNSLSEVLAIARQLSDPLRIATSLGDLGNALVAVGKQGAAEALLREAIDVARKISDHGLSAGLYNNLGNYYIVQGQLEKALRAYQNGVGALSGG